MQSTNIYQKSLPKARKPQLFVAFFKIALILCGTYLSLVLNTQSAVFFFQAFNGQNTLVAACIAVFAVFVLVCLIFLLFCKSFLENLYARVRAHSRTTQALLLLFAMRCAGIYIVQFYANANVNIAYLNNIKAWWFHLPSALGIAENPLSFTLPQWVLSLLFFIPLTVFYLFFATSLFEAVKSVLTTLTKGERRFLCIAAVLTFIYVVLLYNNTDIYYGGLDRIYSYDSLPNSSYLINPFYYWSYYQYPLEPNLSMPILQLADLLPEMSLWRTIAHTLVQVWLLLIAYVMLSRMISKDRYVRLLALLIFSFSFPTLVLAVVTERRVITLIFVLIAIYQSLSRQRDEELWISAASGAVICNAYVFLLTLKPKKDFWKDVLICGFTFAFLLMFFGKASGLLDLRTQINNFESRGWMDENLSGNTKLMHYLCFVRTSLIAPPSHPSETQKSWVMAIPDFYSIIGIVLLVLVLLGFVANYKDRLAQVAFAGVLASFFFVFIKALNINENAVVLNTLFFAWAFVTLMIMAVDKLVRHRAAKYVLLTGVFAGCMIYNAVAALQLYQFGLTAYPI
ncbi:MAG: hypothetical protein GX303_03005 [Clostridiales bacterium]|nr:hypothetical protein [Clostridiales bacterium]